MNQAQPTRSYTNGEITIEVPGWGSERQDERKRGGPVRTQQSPLVVIDANNQLHRLYHAMGAQSAAKAWMRHLRAFRDCLAGGDHSRVYVAFDGPGSSDSRKQLDPAYKGGRDEKKTDLVELLSGASLAAMEMGCQAFSIEGAEADDVIAAIVTRHADERCVIVSSDKDLHQLLEPGRVNQLRKYSVSDGKLTGCTYYTAAQFVEEYRVQPHQWPTWKAIAGDKSDGMPGVPRCGASCASAILERFATFADIEAANQWALPCKNHERLAITAALQNGNLRKWAAIATLRRDCLDLVLSEGGL